jgi:hypothetical protein
MEQLLNVTQCVIDADCHIVNDPIALSCGHCICRKCIPKSGIELWCSKCKEKNKYDLNEAKPCLTAQYCLNDKIEVLLDHAKTKYQTFSESFKSK